LFTTKFSPSKQTNYLKPFKDGLFVLNLEQKNLRAQALSIREEAAASLLLVGRLALAEYCARRGQDSALLERMHAEAVGAWLNSGGSKPITVDDAQSNICANGYIQSLDALKPTATAVEHRLLPLASILRH